MNNVDQIPDVAGDTGKSATSKRCCVVAGAIANKPHNGGESWVRLNWVLGLRRLGFDVYFVEQGGQDGITYLKEVASRFRFSHRIFVVTAEGDVVHGEPASELREVADRAEFLVNISGNLSAPGLLERFRHRAYIDIDPGYTQFWHVSGDLGTALQQHHAWFTVGANIGTGSSQIPSSGIPWRTLRPPVVLDEWPVHPISRSDRLTTVAGWRGAFGALEADGHRYGVKAHQWRRFLELPSMAPQQFEIALAIHPADEKDRQSLIDHGWQLVDPNKVAGGPNDFREYIRGSGGEFSVAQGIYVETNSGWFSDRTAQYLAAGKPVLVQDTGFSRSLPTGEGLVGFTSLKEAEDGARRIAASYDSHAQAARQLAETYFDSDRVLCAFLDELGVERPAHS
jgi:hypothetical protein